MKWPKISTIKYVRELFLNLTFTIFKNVFFRMVPSSEMSVFFWKELHSKEKWNYRIFSHISRIERIFAQNGLQFKKIPYILTYKSRNFGRFFEPFSSIQLIHGSNFIKSKTLKNWLFLHFEDFDRWLKALIISEVWRYFWTYVSILLIRVSTYT